MYAVQAIRGINFNSSELVNHTLAFIRLLDVLLCDAEVIAIIDMQTHLMMYMAQDLRSLSFDELWQ